jgi:glyoxylate reductase
MARCIVTRSLPGQAIELLCGQHEVETWPLPRPPSAEELRSLVGHADGLLCCITDRIDARLFDAAPQLRVVSNYGAGYDNIDLGGARSRQIAVGITPDVVTASTAEVALLLLLAVARRLPEAASAVRAGQWGTWDPSQWLGSELAGSRLVVVGGGRTGLATAQRARAFDMDVTVVGRSDDLVNAVAQADAVSVHVPLTPTTHHLIDATVLRAMQPHAVFVNTSRGAIVDQAALREALIEGWIGGAGLDVTAPEPLSPEDPLFDAPNLLILPHIGSATHRTREGMTERAVANLLEGLADRPLPYPAL